ncbi:MAG: cupin domain-containing protein [Deltaproteobacteria bacterium]|nr:cupin domain-containing protein [Deltaproteobacteria bacterium]MBW2397175.1 cupin domain-containing protein [Deltaproteobacteria bacterium]
MLGKQVFRYTSLLIGAYMGIGVLLHYVIFPEASPDMSSYPSAGDSVGDSSSAERFVFRTTTRETEGERFTFDFFLRPGAKVPTEHVHSIQEERFEVLEGTLTVTLASEEILLQPGDVAVVPPGVAHQAFNRGETEAHALVDVRPSGNLDMFFVQLERSGVSMEPPGAQAGLQFARFMQEYEASYSAGMPIVAQKALAFLVAPTARLLGYRNYYAERGDR